MKLTGKAQDFTDQAQLLAAREQGATTPRRVGEMADTTYASGARVALVDEVETASVERETIARIAQHGISGTGYG